jgi:hypothetical protein
MTASGALAGANLGAQLGRAATAAQASPPGPQPNILFIFADELRFPSVFPAGR